MVNVPADCYSEGNATWPFVGAAVFFQSLPYRALESELENENVA